MNMHKKNLLKEIRIKKGLKQGWVASQLGITRQAYHNYETKKSTPSLDTLQKMNKILGIPLGTLFNYYRKEN